MGHIFTCTKDYPVVQTKAGKIRGFVYDGIFTFHGIKYADAERFQAPRPVASWEGIKDAHAYGYCCPMLAQDQPTCEVMTPHRYWLYDENCQYLNLWTKSLDADAKKPVLVWFHGGGFAAGSSIEQQAYDGFNMANLGDVVVVTVNHRLNILGYMDLHKFGEKYKGSANAGSLDMIESLRWVRDNIAGFGGDPENVTIFGQSGGGIKVWSLMQMPAADGLFRRGICMSGLIQDFLPHNEDGTDIANAMLKELGLPENDIEALAKVSYHDMAQAYNKVMPGIAAQGKYIGGNPIPNEDYLGDPREVGFCDRAKNTPLIIGTVFGEFAFGPAIAGKYEMSEEEMTALLKKKYKDNTDDMIRMFKEAYPEKNLTDLLSLDSIFRDPTLDFIMKKAKHQEAPTYSYIFTYEFPFDGGKVSWHCSDIPFVFHNTQVAPVCGSPEAEKLEEQIFATVMAFAKTGDPNNALIPEWPACKADDEAVMIFDTECRIKHNHDHDLIRKHAVITPRFGQREPDDGPIIH